MKKRIALGALLALGMLSVGACSSDGSGSSGSSASAACRAFYSKAQDCGVLSAGRVPSCEDVSGRESEVKCQTDCLNNSTCEDISGLFCGGTSSLSSCFSTCVETFECGDGQSVPLDYYCDGGEDCSDGSDEPAGCRPPPGVSEGSGGSSASFSCGDGESIPTSWVCDGEGDCSDRSDEVGCASAICDPNQG